MLFDMPHSTKTNISLALILLVVAVFGCQRQGEQRPDVIPAVSTMEDTTPTDIAPSHTIGVPQIIIRPRETFTDPYMEELRRLMLQEKYEEALRLMPQVREERLARAEGNKEEESLHLFTIRQAYLYLYMMLDRDEEAYKKIKEMPIEPSGLMPPHLIHMDNILVLLRLNKADGIIIEAHKLLGIPDIPFHMDNLAYTTLITAYLINNDNENALKTVGRWKKMLADTQLDEDIRRRFVQEAFVYEYFIKNQLQTEYYVVFGVERPDPPTISPLNRERISFRYGHYGTDIISRRDGSHLDGTPIIEYLRERIDSFMESSRRHAPSSLHDPFPIMFPDNAPTRPLWNE
jgi:hypothetical protein